MKSFLSVLIISFVFSMCSSADSFGKDPELKIGVNAAALRAFNSSDVIVNDCLTCVEHELTEVNTAWKAGAVANLSFSSIDFLSLELRAGVFGFETQDVKQADSYVALDVNQNPITTTTESYIKYNNRVYYLELLAELSIDGNFSLLGGLGINYMDIAEKKLVYRIVSPENVMFVGGTREKVLYQGDLKDMNKVVPSLILGVKYELELFDIFSICPYINYSLMLLPIDRSINWKYNSFELGMSIMIKVY